MARKHLAAVVFAASVSAFALSASAAVPDTKAASILDAVRKATLSRPLSSISTIHSSGNGVIVGIKCRLDEYDDVRAGRTTTVIVGGALSGASGWDGSKSWNQDYSGLVHVDGGESGRLQSIDQAYVSTLAYLRSDRGGAAISYAGQKQYRGKTYDVVAMTPPRGSELNFWIDPATHLIAKTTTTVGLQSFTSTFSDYRNVGGLKVPFRTAFQSSTGNSGSASISKVSLNENVASHIAMPASDVHDFSVGGGSTTVPLEIVNNHLYVHATVNGQGPYTFILDSGGDYIITPEVANAAHIASSGGVQIGGVGNTTEGAGFVHVDSVAVGNATVRNQYMLVLPIGPGFGVSEGMHIDGMIGYQWLARFLTTIDYANGKITFAMPTSSPAAQDGASAVSFFFDESIPRIPISVNGVSTTGEVDTGSRSALTLSSPFVAAHPSIGALAKTAPGVDGFGVGGPSYGRLGRIPTLQIGPYTLDNSIASFGVQQKGAFADPFNPANLGGAIWRRFTVTFDYPHERMLLQKNASFDTPFSYDRSGMFLIDNKGAYTVISVMPGTPAASSGLEKGDVIVNVNGTPASDESLAQLRSMLSGPAGSVVRLHVRNVKGERDIAVTLRDYV